MTIRVDEEKCCGAGQCVLTAPEVFDQREEDGVVVVLDAHPMAMADRAAAREAAAVCPTGAITTE